MKIKIDFLKQKRLAAMADKFASISEQANEALEELSNETICMVIYGIGNGEVPIAHLIKVEPITVDNWLEKVFGNG